MIAARAPLLDVEVPGLLIVNISNERAHWSKAMLKSRAQRAQTLMLVGHAFRRASPAVRGMIVELALPSPARSAGREARGARSAPSSPSPEGEQASLQTGFRPDSNGLLIVLHRHFVGGQRDYDLDDNLNISLKHVRDGVADALGFNDGSKLVRFQYGQHLSKTPGARVQIYEREACSRCGELTKRRDE